MPYYPPSGGGSGGVSAVTASGILSSSGGTTPDITLTGIVPVENGGTGQDTPIDLVYVLGSTASGAVALTPVDSAGFSIYIPLSDTDSTIHTINIGIRGIIEDYNFIQFITTGAGDGAILDASVQFNQNGSFLTPVSGNSVSIGMGDMGLTNPVTDLFGVNGYGLIGELDSGLGDSGGMLIGGGSSSDAQGLAIFGVNGSNTPTQGAVFIGAAKYDGGTGIMPFADDELMASFVNSFGGTTVLSVYGDGSILTSGKISVGSDSGFVAGKYFSFAQTQTDFTPSYSVMAEFNYVIEPTVDLVSPNFLLGVQMGAFVPNTNTKNIYSIFGTQSYLEFYGSGELGQGVAHEIEAYNHSSGAVSYIAGFTAQAYQDGAGLVSQLNAGYYQSGTFSAGSGGTTLDQTIFIDTPSNEGGAMITHVGIDVANQNIGTSYFAIRTGLGPVKFGDNVSIGGALSGTVAALEIISTTQGLLLPRMTTTQRNAITPVEGLVVVDITIHGVFEYNGSSWVQL